MIFNSYINDWGQDQRTALSFGYGAVTITITFSENTIKVRFCTYHLCTVVFSRLWWPHTHLSISVGVQRQISAYPNIEGGQFPNQTNSSLGLGYGYGR